MGRHGRASIGAVVLGLAILVGLPVGATAAEVTHAATSGCVATGMDASDDTISVSGGDFGNKLAGSVAGLTIPCRDSLALVTLTVELSGNATGVFLFYLTRVFCVAPAIPGGCVPSATPIASFPDAFILTTSSVGNIANLEHEARTSTLTYTGLLPGNYDVRGYLTGDGAAYRVGRRVFTVQATGTPPPAVRSGR